MLTHKQSSKGEKNARIQAKLSIGQPGDKYEQEADRNADRIMRKTTAGPQSQPQPPLEEQAIQAKIRMQPMEEEEEMMMPKVQMQPMEEEEEMMQTKPKSGTATSASPAMSSAITSQKGRGQNLSASSRKFFTSGFGTSFNNVKIHNGALAHKLNQQLNSRAFTVGSDIFFRQGEYSPETSRGKRLLAHELTHVIQQKGMKDATARRKIQRLSIGPGPTADRDWRAVPDNHKPRVNQALALIRRVAQNRRLKNYFRDHAPGGTINTLQNVVNRAVVWELRREGNLGLSVQGGNDMAYDTFMYRLGRYSIAATLLHEMGHLANFATEPECENAPEAARMYAPFITDISTRSGSVGDVVTITGISFGPSQSSVDKVKFNGVDAGNAIFWRWRHNTQGQIRVRVPAGATTGNVWVENNRVRSNGIRFTVNP